MGYPTKEWGATVLFTTKQVGDKEWGGGGGGGGGGGALFVHYYNSK